MIHTLRRAMIVTLAALAGVIGACGSNDSTGPDGPGDPNTSAAGVFTLTKVDSKSLPFTVLTDSFYTLEVTSGTAVLDTAGHFIMPLTTRETVAGHASTYVDTTRGTWLQAAGVITLTVQPGATSTTAAWDGRHLTVGFAIGTATNNYVYTRN